jgi:lipopolysaccharide heptosyltransferase I
MRILFIKLSAIGDVVQTLPALEAIKKLYPDSEITWLVEEAAAGILEGHPLIGKLLISKRKEWTAMLGRPRSFMRGVKGIAGFLRDLRSVQYDIAVDFQGLLKSGVLTGLARAKRKIGFDGTRELSYLFLNERLPRYDIEKHSLERYLDIARHLGAANPSSTCRLPIASDIRGMSEKISAIKKEGSPLVVINPIARWNTKLWLERNFAELADLLMLRQKAVVVFTGSRADSEAIERIRGMMKQTALNWAGRTSLKELAALASSSDLFITTDTGPMHLAAAAGARVLALFGPTAPWRTGPYGSSHAVVRTGIECSPCFKRKCDKNIQCMRGISVAEVLSRINSLPLREGQEGFSNQREVV